MATEPLWAATAALLGRARSTMRGRRSGSTAIRQPLDAAARSAVGDEAVDAALAAHAARRVS